MIFTCMSVERLTRRNASVVCSVPAVPAFDTWKRADIVSYTKNTDIHERMALFMGKPSFNMTPTTELLMPVHTERPWSSLQGGSTGASCRSSVSFFGPKRTKPL